MSKKIISLILCGILVFGTFSTSYAISTDSAIKATKELKSNDLRANPPDGSSSNPYYINPQSSSGTRYYVNDSSGTVSSASVYVTTWGDLMNHLSYTIAYSIKAVTSRLSTLVTNLSTYLNSTASSSYYYWDWTPTNGVQQGAPELAENIVTAVRNIGMQTTKSLSYIAEYTYQISDFISNNGFGNVQIDDNPNNGFNQDYLWKKYLTNSNGTLRTITPGGTLSTQSVNFQNMSALGAIEALLYYTAQGATNGIGNIIRDVRDNNDALVDYTYDKDMNPTMLPRTGMWANMRQGISNISYHLSRLGFVLASDEEIAARQAASANQDAVVDDFIKPTGSVSASASDFTDVASIGGTMKDALDSNVSAGSAFTSLSSSSDAWEWFSTDTANSLDTTSNQRSSLSSTPLLDNYYSEVLENLRFK